MFLSDTSLLSPSQAVLTEELFLSFVVLRVESTQGPHAIWGVVSAGDQSGWRLSRLSCWSHDEALCSVPVVLRLSCLGCKHMQSSRRGFITLPATKGDLLISQQNSSGTSCPVHNLCGGRHGGLPCCQYANELFICRVTKGPA